MDVNEQRCAMCIRYDYLKKQSFKKIKTLTEHEKKLLQKWWDIPHENVIEFYDNFHENHYLQKFSTDELLFEIKDIIFKRFLYRNTDHDKRFLFNEMLYRMCKMDGPTKEMWRIARRLFKKIQTVL